MIHKVATPLVTQQHEWESKLELIRRTVAKDATNDELEMFFHQARKTGLDPLARQIYFVKRQGKGTIQTGIDGYRLVADRTGKYAGNDDYEFDDPDNAPKWAKARVWKIVEGIRCQFEATARWSQYYPGDAQGWAWKKMPHLMLGKCAEALALRKAFPAELSGIYTVDEMAQAGPTTAHSDGLTTLECEDCGNPIDKWEGDVDDKHFKYTLAQIQVISRKLYEKDLCGDCLQVRKLAKLKAAQEAADEDSEKRAQKAQEKLERERQAVQHETGKPKKKSKQTDFNPAEFEVTDQEIAEFREGEILSPPLSFK